MIEFDQDINRIDLQAPFPLVIQHVLFPKVRIILTTSNTSDTFFLVEYLATLDPINIPQL